MQIFSEQFPLRKRCLKRSRCWNHFIVYDECDSAFASFDDHAFQGSKTEIVVLVYCNRCHRDCCDWLYFQRIEFSICIALVLALYKPLYFGICIATELFWE